MVERPTGTVTFLFTDIEGSTRLVQELGGARYAAVLEDHRRLLRTVFTGHHGHELGTEGDSFFVAFPHARDAVAAASEGQMALAGHAWPDAGLHVRMGIHTTEALATEDGYVGIGVHRAARICSAGHGGQVLVSQTTAGLLRDDGGAIELVDLGEYRLRDLTEPQRLFQLAVAGLGSVFPPLRTLGTRPTNLPVQATPIIGREREVQEVSRLLRHPDIRVVTLTGPGGTGKTRLALQAAAELVDDFPHGVYFVGLASIRDADLVVPSIAQALGVNEAAGQSLPAYLATKRMLLVVDNLEQVMTAALPLVELLDAGPGIRILATSREPLHVAAEHVFPVAPLGPAEAVALFVERARQVAPDFEVTHLNEQAVAEVCARLDGLPLALELAAARIPLLTPERMLRRLSERLKLLTGVRRDSPARQQTLRDTLAWSYDLLDEEERRLFERLAVFSGGFSLEAAEEVCDADLGSLGSLVEKSLVRPDGERFAMLETISEYALERLASRDDADVVRDRHAAFYEGLADRAYPQRIVREREWSDELETEHDNLRSSLERSSSHHPERHLALAGALGWFWHVHSHFAEGRARLTQALAGAPEPTEHRARALAGAGELAAWQADAPAAEASIGEAITIWKLSGQEQEIALALHQLGWAYFFAGDDRRAKESMQESVELQRRLGDALLINRAQLGLIQMLVSLGETEQVEQMAPEALDVAKRLGDLRSEHFAYHFLADCPLIRGESAVAEERYRRALEAAARLGDRVETSIEIQGVAMASAGLGRSHRALTLAGAADAELEALGVDLSGVVFWNALLKRYLGNARAALGASGAEAAWAAGRRLGFDKAIEEALADAATAQPEP